MVCHRVVFVELRLVTGVNGLRRAHEVTWSGVRGFPSVARAGVFTFRPGRSQTLISPLTEPRTLLLSTATLSAYSNRTQPCNAQQISTRTDRSTMSTAISTGLGSRLVSSSVQATGFTELPILDLTPILPSSNSTLEEKQALALKVQAACVDVGFFLVKNHGVDESVFEEALRQARAFFALPLEEKLKIDMKNAKSFKGYICQSKLQGI